MVSPCLAALALVDELADAGVRVFFEHDGSVATFGDVPDALGDRLRALLGEGGTREGLASHRALRAVLGAPTRGVRELHALPVVFAKLPVPYAVTLARKGKQALFTTSGRIYNRELGRVPLFVLRELTLAAQAFEQGRAGPAQLDQWLSAKSRGAWVLTSEIAEVAESAEPPSTGLTLGDLADGLGAELVDLELQEAA